MITTNMKSSLDDPDCMGIVVAYLTAIENHDIGALRRMLHRDVELTHANYPTVAGRDIAVDMIESYLNIIDAVEFEVLTVVGVNRMLIIEKVNLAKTRRMGVARVRVVTILEHDGQGQITSVRIYGDTADLFRAFLVEKSEGIAPP